MQKNTMQDSTLKVVSHVYEYKVSTNDYWDKSICLMEHYMTELISHWRGLPLIIQLHKAHSHVHDVYITHIRTWDFGRGTCDHDLITSEWGTWDHDLICIDVRQLPLKVLAIPRQRGRTIAMLRYFLPSATIKRPSATLPIGRLPRHFTPLGNRLWQRCLNVAATKLVTWDSLYH